MSIRRRAGTLGTVVTQTGVTCHVSRDGDTAWSHPSAQWLRLDKKVRQEGRVMDSLNVSPHPF